MCVPAPALFTRTTALHQTRPIRLGARSVTTYYRYESSWYIFLSVRVCSALVVVPSLVFFSWQPFSETGKYFHPTEMHGITIQEGPDGNTDEKPTYWFWHPWACAGNVSGCPWVGHGNASRIFDSYLVTVGHGATLNMNIPPERTGQMNASVALVMRDVGKAINDTFRNSVVEVKAASADCGRYLKYVSSNRHVSVTTAK